MADVQSMVSQTVDLLLGWQLINFSVWGHNALEEELQSSRAKMVEMEQKMMEQDWVITQLVGDNLNHL